MGVKKFIKKSVAFVAAAAMALTMVVAPVGAGEAYAAEGTGSTTADSNPNLVLDKTAKLQSDGTYTITLEAYAKGEVVTTPEVIKPCDIVLVLDQSGSMQWDFKGNNSEYSKSRQKALQDAAKSFIENVATNAANKKVDHKIAIVSFGSDATEKPEFVSLYSQSDSSQNVNGKNALTATIDKLGQEPEGATRTDLGMQKANELITSTDNSRNRVVVVFTDGYPTSSSKFNIGVADAAISAGKELKDKNAKIYTVGIFEGADVSQVSGASSDEVGQDWKVEGIITGERSDGMDAASNRFLNYLSSNFRDPTSIALKRKLHLDGYYYYEITQKFERNYDKYYMTAYDRTGLSKIFEKISDEVSAGKTDVTLDESAVAKDIMSDDFNLPKNITDNVKVYTEEYNGKDASNNPKWKNRQPLTNAYVSYNTGEKSISVSGFSYKDNYIVDGQGSVATSGKKLIIVITDVTAKNAGMNMYTNNSNSAIYDGEGGKVKEFPMPQQSIDSTSYVLDYGKTVTTAASDYGVSAVTIANADEPSPYNPNAKKSENRTNVNLTGTYGKFAKKNGNLDYTPGKINWDGIDRGYVFGAKDENTLNKETEEEKSGKNYSAYKWEEVNFMPASSVYYEDDFGTDDNGDANVAIVWTGKWSSGTSNGGQQSASNSDYGWDDSYVGDTGFSNGSAHSSSQKLASATFRFTGTGVDVYSRTNSGVGKISTTLRKVTKNADGTDTAEDIEYKSIDNLAVTGDYYQIPTLTYDGLQYGTYEVTIKVVTVSKENRGIYYLDGIRVYNPLKGNQTAEDAYDKANEANAKYITVRSGLIDTTNTSVITSKMEGSVFIDKVANPDSEENTTTDIGTYEDYGPKNEVYLKSGQGVAFTIKNYNSTTDKVAVGLKSPTGSEVTVDVTAGAKKANPLVIQSASDLYYEVTPTSDGKVVIKNTSGALLSVTKVKITSKNAAPNSAPNERSLVVTPELMSYVDIFDTLPVQEDTTDDNQGSTAGDSKDDMLDKDDVDIDNPSDNDKDNSNEDNNSEANKPNNIWNQIISSIKGWFRK